MAQTIAATGLTGLDAVIVEDDEQEVELIGSALRGLGVALPRVAGSVKDGLLAIRLRRPDIVVLDASLQGLPDHEVVQELRGGRIPFIVVTDYAREVLPPSFEATTMLRKPYTASALVEMLLSVLQPEPGSAPLRPASAADT